MSLFTITNESLDRTVKIFDAFYNSDLNIPADQYDIVFSFFKGVCANKIIAENYTVILFFIAKNADISAMFLLENIKGTTKNKLEINKIMAYYLNSFKSKTSLYGVGQIPRPNQPVARNVVL